MTLAEAHIEPAALHRPVMCGQVVRALAVRKGGFYLDATFGAGGYTRAILEMGAACVIAIDRDEESLREGAALARRYGKALRLFHARFSEMARIAAPIATGGLDGVVFDLGVSSMQLDRACRGFSFLRDGPLDMRMGHAEHTAAALVARLSEGELAALFRDYGEERHAPRIARAIVKARARSPITRTLELARLVEVALPQRRSGSRHPATKVFQALRIAVNDELEELRKGLAAAEGLLRTGGRAEGGRLVVVSFHSLEDRIVKRFLRARSGERPHASRHLPDVPAFDGAARPEPAFALLHRGALTPDAQESVGNPRARSARLRAAFRLPPGARGKG